MRGTAVLVFSRIVFAGALGAIVAAVVVVVGFGGSPAPAGASSDAAGPAFAAVPRFETGRAAPARLGSAQANSAACNPGPERVAPGNRDVYLDLPLRRVAAKINNPTETNPLTPDEPVYDALELRAYSGCLTSPMIEALPGQTLHVMLHNELAANDPTCNGSPAGQYLQLPTDVGCFNTTNFHSHGLHVSPNGDSDNVLRVMPPRSRPYPITIALPPDHPAGTFWYHAHMHGSTAVGVSSADAGVLVVRGNRDWAHRAQNHGIVDVDTILHGADQVPFPDTVFMLQQIPYGCFFQPATPTQIVTAPYDQLMTTAGMYTTADSQTQGTPPPSATAPWTCSYPGPGSPPPGKITPGVVENFDSQLFSASIWDTNGRFTSVNGVVQPQITVPAGAIQRWRFVHAGVHDTVNLQVLRMTPRVDANGRRRTLASMLDGKTRRQQESIVKSVCSPAPSTVVPQLEIAVDGLTRTKVNAIRLAPAAIANVVSPVASNYLQPGYRSDILIAFPEPGEYCLLDQAAPAGEHVVIDPHSGQINGGGSGPNVAQLLGYVHVQGGTPIRGSVETYVTDTLYAGNAALPARVRNGLRAGDLTAFAPFVALAPPSPQLLPAPRALFEIGNINPNGFGVNGQAYAPGSVQNALIRQLGTTDDWHVEILPTPAPNPAPPATPTPSSAEPHIFHIHINPFEVMDVQKISYTKTGKLVKRSIFDASGKCNRLAAEDSMHLADQYCGLYHVFRDTLFIQNGYDVTLRTHYSKYTGFFVLHCHILDHEDAGMMANVQIAVDRLHPPTMPPSAMGMAKAIRARR